MEGKMLRTVSDSRKIGTRNKDRDTPERWTQQHEKTPLERRTEERNALRIQRLFALAGQL
jgi:hypothetical protein